MSNFREALYSLRPAAVLREVGASQPGPVEDLTPGSPRPNLTSRVFVTRHQSDEYAVQLPNGEVCGLHSSLDSAKEHLADIDAQGSRIGIADVGAVIVHRLRLNCVSAWEPMDSGGAA